MNIAEPNTYTTETKAIVKSSREDRHAVLVVANKHLGELAPEMIKNIWAKRPSEMDDKTAAAFWKLQSKTLLSAFVALLIAIIMLSASQSTAAADDETPSHTLPRVQMVAD